MSYEHQLPRRSGAAMADTPWGLTRCGGFAHEPDCVQGNEVDIWNDDTADWAERRLGGSGAPFRRAWHSATFCPILGEVVIFGGQSSSGACLGDIWHIDVATDPPTAARFIDVKRRARSHHAAAWCEHESRIVVAGGISDTGKYLDDIAFFDVTSGAWTPLAFSLPRPLKSPSLSTAPPRPGESASTLFCVGGEPAPRVVFPGCVWTASLGAAPNWHNVAELTRGAPLSGATTFATSEGLFVAGGRTPAGGRPTSERLRSALPAVAAKMWTLDRGTGLWQCHRLETTASSVAFTGTFRGRLEIFEAETGIKTPCPASDAGVQPEQPGQRGEVGRHPFFDTPPAPPDPKTDCHPGRAEPE